MKTIFKITDHSDILQKSLKVTRLLLPLAQSRFTAAQYLEGRAGQTSSYFFSLFCNLFPLLQERKCQVKSEKTPSLSTPIQITQTICFTKSLGDNFSLDLKRMFLCIFPHVMKDNRNALGRGRTYLWELRQG